MLLDLINHVEAAGCFVVIGLINHVEAAGCFVSSMHRFAAVAMNNTLVMLAFLVMLIGYDLQWRFSAESVALLLVCASVGAFALYRWSTFRNSGVNIFIKYFSLISHPF